MSEKKIQQKIPSRVPKFNVIHLNTFYLSSIKPIQVAIVSSNIVGKNFGVCGIKRILFYRFHIGGIIVDTAHVLRIVKNIL
jgi:hypothetical protein